MRLCPEDYFTSLFVFHPIVFYLFQAVKNSLYVSIFFVVCNFEYRIVSTIICAALAYFVSLFSFSKRLKGLLDREKEELAEAEVIKDSPDSPEPPNKKPLITVDELPTVEKAKGKPEELQLLLLKIEIIVRCVFQSRGESWN